MPMPAAMARFSESIFPLCGMSVLTPSCANSSGSPLASLPKISENGPDTRATASSSGTAPVSMNGKSCLSGNSARYASNVSKWRIPRENAAPIDARVTRGSSESTAGRMIAMLRRPKPSAVRRIVPMLPLSLG